MTIAIDRGFVRTSIGLIHYRSAGKDEGAPPLVLLHGGPGSSAGFATLIASLAGGRRMLAPDTAGCGSSEPLPDGEPSIVRYAEILAEFLDRLGHPLVDVYGHHTGAQIACELAIAQPQRIRRLILDGVALFPAALREEFLELYAPPIAPRADGSHLLDVWGFVSQLTQHFPHYRQDEAHRVMSEIVLAPAAITALTAEILTVLPTWHLAYHAAFRHDLAARLPLVRNDSLVLRATGDPLAIYAETAATLLAKSALVDVSRINRAEAISAFLSA